MKNLILIFVFLIIFISNSLSQDDIIDFKDCGFDADQHVLLSNKSEVSIRQQYEEAYRNHIKSSSQNTNKRLEVYTIPTVVHIIHDGAPMGTVPNLRDDQVSDVINQTSERFRYLQDNAPSFDNTFYGIDTEIDFCLATTDPNGDFTTGITRLYSPELAVNNYDVLRAKLDLLKWDITKYCNLFIITDLTNAAGVYLGGSDIVIFDSAGFWSGLAAHEIGHYFTLQHTFSDDCKNDDCTMDGDRVCDTPPKNDSGRDGNSCDNPADFCTTDEDDSSSNNPYRAVSLGGMGNQPDSYENYMDYTGACWNTFTQGQTDRMRFNIEETRLSMVNNQSIACQEQAAPAVDITLSAIDINRPDICSNYFSPTIKIENSGTQSVNTATLTISLNGIAYITEEWNGSLAPNNSISYQMESSVYVEPGDYTIGISCSTDGDANIHNNTNYDKFKYIGGISCAQFDNCQDFNPNTGSGNGNTTIIQIEGAWENYDITNGATICISAQGDLSGSSESFIVLDENNVDRGLTNSIPDCRGLSPDFCFEVNSENFIEWVQNDNKITITLDPITANINPTLCNINNACATVYVPQGEISSTDDLSSIGIVISPNPATNFINIKSHNPVEAQIAVYSITGELLKSKEMNISAQLDIQELRNGIYFLKILDKTSKRISIKKIHVINQ